MITPNSCEHNCRVCTILCDGAKNKTNINPHWDYNISLHQLRIVLEYVDEHYSENISLSQLASLSNMSNQHFCRVFKNSTGKRPMDYNKAVGLLEKSDFNISEIAMAVGFDDSNYFSRLFKKYQKTSPSAIRK